MSLQDRPSISTVAFRLYRESANRITELASIVNTYRDSLTPTDITTVAEMIEEAAIKRLTSSRADRSRQEFEMRAKIRITFFGVPFPTAYSDLYRQAPVRSFSKAAACINWNLAYFKQFSLELSAWLPMKKRFERLFLLGEYDKADLVLIDCKQQFGVSFWWMYSDFLVREWRDGVKSNKAALQRVNESASRPVLLVAFHLSLRAERNITPEVLNENFEQFRTKNPSQGDLVRFSEYLCNPYDIEPQNIVQLMLTQSERLCAIDRYELFINTVRSEAARSGPHAAKLLRSLRRSLQAVNDERAVFTLWLEGESSYGSSEYNPVLAVGAHYTSGRFSDCVISGRAATLQFPEVPSCYEFTTLASLYAEEHTEVTTLNSPSNYLFKHLRQLLDKDISAKESSRALLKLSHNFVSLELGWWLYELVLVHTSTQITKYISRRANYCAIAPVPILPIKHGPIAQAARIVCSCSISETSVQQWMNEVVGIIQAVLKKTDFQISTQVSSYSHFRTAEILMLQSRYLEATEEFRRCIGTADVGRGTYSPHMYESALVNLINLALMSGDIRSDCDLLADWLLEHQFSCHRLAIHPESLELVGLLKAIRDSVSSPIIFRACGFSARAVFVALDNFLIHVGIGKPTELDWKQHNDIPLGRIIYFLHEVCTIDVLESLISLKTYEAVRAERLLLLKTLSDLDPKYLAVYSQESIQVSRESATLRMKAHVKESKIYVDVGGIRRAEATRFADAFSRYNELRGTSIRLDAIVQLELGASGFNDNKELQNSLGKIRRSTRSEARLELFKDLFGLVRDAFLFNPHFGLDSCLSVRIRHGSLFRQVCAPFAEAHLLCRRVRDGGPFLGSKFWEQHAADLSEPATVRLHDSLFALSQRVEELANTLVRDVIRVTTSEENQTALFQFFFSDEELYELSENEFRDCDTLESFESHVFETLQVRLDTHLTAVRSYLERSFQAELHDCLDEFTSRCSEDRFEYPINEVQQDVQLCKALIDRDIKAICKWFYTSSSEPKGICDLEMIRDAAAEIISSFFPELTGGVRLPAVEPFQLDGSYFDPCVYILLILADNAVKHCGLPVDELLLTMKCSHEDGTINLCVVNNLSADRSEQDPVRSIEEACGGSLDQRFDVRIRREGKSGYPKLLNILRQTLKQPFPRIVVSKILLPPELTVRVAIETRFLKI